MKSSALTILMLKYLGRMLVLFLIIAALATCTPKRSLHHNYKKQKRKCSDCPSFTHAQTPLTPVYACYKTTR